MYDSSTRLLCPSDMEPLNTSPYKRIYKQIIASERIDHIYLRVSKTQAITLKYALDVCNYYCNDQLNNITTVKYFPLNKITGILEEPAMLQQYKIMQNNPTIESYTYGFMNTLLTNLFKVQDGYIVSPQSKQVDGEADFLVSYKGKVVVVVESNALNGKYTGTAAHIQAVEYANTNKRFASVFVVVNKGEYISIGLYVEDFHNINRLKKKSTFFDGFIGLEVNNNLNVKPMQQLNIFYPQLRFYKAWDNKEHNACIYTLFDFMKNQIDKGGPNAQCLDFGPKFLVDRSDGAVYFKKGEKHNRWNYNYQRCKY